MSQFLNDFKLKLQQLKESKSAIQCMNFYVIDLAISQWIEFRCDSANEAAGVWTNLIKSGIYYCHIILYYIIWIVQNEEQLKLLYIANELIQSKNLKVF